MLVSKNDFISSGLSGLFQKNLLRRFAASDQSWSDAICLNSMCFLPDKRPTWPMRDEAKIGFADSTFGHLLSMKFSHISSTPVRSVSMTSAFVIRCFPWLKLGKHRALVLLHMLSGFFKAHLRRINVLETLCGEQEIEELKVIRQPVAVSAHRPKSADQDVITGMVQTRVTHLMVVLHHQGQN